MAGQAAESASGEDTPAEDTDGAAADPAAPDAERQPDAAPDEETAVESGEGGGAEPAETPSARLATIRVLRTEEAIQTSDRMAHETREVAAEFDRILLELDNNNVSFLDEFERRIGGAHFRPA